MRWLCFHPRPSKPRLLAWPHAGAHAACFRALSSALTQFELHAYTPPGRAHRRHEPTLVRFQDIVDDALAEAPVDTKQPTFVYGHSFGALCAFHGARLLLEQHHIVKHVVVAARGPQHIPAGDAIDDDDLLAQLASVDPSIAVLRAEPELWALAAPTLRADLRASSDVVITTTLPVPILALGGTLDPSTPQSSLDAWRAHTHSHCAAFVPGAHLFHQTNANELAAYLERFLC
jgi:medium-chain acyl-[acyl-carrier-protein] hydrolase